MTLDVSSDHQRRRLRDVFGSFATGVTVVTARDRDGNPIGITVNSFTSVSISPPLLLWCVGRDSSSCEDFANAKHFAVNVLSDAQEPLALRFASKQADKFSGLAGVQEGIGGVPLLPECIGQLQCAHHRTYEGGDHLILVGEVLAIAEGSQDPLLFIRGRLGGLHQQAD